MFRSRPAIFAAVLATALLVAPATLYASHRFEDVPSDSPFHDEINAVAEAGVTQGCAPDRFCPGEEVTRRQMAAFLARLGALQPGSEPVVNADAVDGRQARDLAWTPGVPVQVLHQVETWEVSNPEGNEVECLETTVLFEEGAQTPVGAYTESFQVWRVPDTPDFGPWDVNVQIAFVDGGRFQVCFRTISGAPLPPGTYRTFRQELVTIGVS